MTANAPDPSPNQSVIYFNKEEISNDSTIRNVTISCFVRNAITAPFAPSTWIVRNGNIRVVK